jgi:hypothetical protein
MKKNRLTFYLSVVVAGLWACSSADDVGAPTDQKWEMSTVASKDSGDIVDIDDAATRALFIGGSTGKSFASLWDNKDEVKVYRAGVEVGTLKPQSAFVRSTPLTGTLSGSFTVGESLDFYLISPNVDYTGQTGTLQDLTNFAYMASTVNVANAVGTTVTTEDVAFTSKQFYLRLRFMDADGIRLPVEQLVIHAAGGKLVQTKPLNGEATYGDIVVNTVKEHGQYPSELYVCMHNDLGAKDTYTFTVKSGGYIYASGGATNSLISSNLKDGGYYLANKYLTLVSADASRILTSSAVSDFQAGNGPTGESGAVAF